MRRLMIVVVLVTALVGCGGSYAYRRYESYGGDESGYWYFRWEQRSDHRRTDRRPPMRHSTDIYHYGGRTEVKTAPPLEEETKKTVAVKMAERRVRSAVDNKKRQ